MCRIVALMPRTSVALPFSGAKLRALRDRKGLRQQDLSDKTAEIGRRIPSEDISRYENSRLVPSAARFGLLMQALDCDPDDLLDDTAGAA